MPTLRVIRILDPALLLERAVAGLFPLGAATPEAPWPTLPAWIVLRQGGLRDDLHRLASQKGIAGWFDPPICLFSEMRARWGADEPRERLSEAERLAILLGLVERFGGNVFGKLRGVDAWVPAVDRLIGEIAGEGISPDAFQRALHDSATDSFGRDRADALARIYAEWIGLLDREKRRDGRDGKIRLAAQITADPAGFTNRLGGRREIRIVGLADLRGGWRQLLAALAASPALDRVEFLVSSPLELSVELGAQYEEAADAPATFAQSLFSKSVPASSSVRLMEAADAAREIELIAVRIRRLVDSGTAPSRIAVISRQPRPTVDDMARALTRLGVPVTARRRVGLAHTGPARALRAILATARDSFSRHSVVELAENPLLDTGLDANVVNSVGFAKPIVSRAGWREAFAAMLKRCESRDGGAGDENERRKQLPHTDDVRVALKAWDALDERLAELERPRSLAKWFEWVAAMLQGGRWGLPDSLAKPIADREAARNDGLALDLIAKSARGWAAALTTFGADSMPIDAQDFSERLPLLLDADMISPSPTDFGIVIGEALAVGWRAFDHVFVTGLAAGVFPQRTATGGILDPEDRKALVDAGLPLDPRDAWRDRERELFRVVCAGARNELTVSWPGMDSTGREVARSTFVDEAVSMIARARGFEDPDDTIVEERLIAAGIFDRVPTQQMLVPGFPVANDAGAIAHARLAAAREGERTHAPSCMNGLIEDPALLAWMGQQYGESFMWSATQLESVAKCRWQWFASRLLRLEERADGNDLMEPTVRGSLMHDALHRFYDSAKRKVGGPVFLRAGDAGWASALMRASLNEAWDDALAKGIWLGSVTMHRVVRVELAAELHGYLKFEIEWNEKSYDGRTGAAKQIRSGAVEGEVEFKDVRLAAGGVTFLLRGSIDRLDRGVDERISGAERYISAIDYKSTKYAAPAGGNPRGWDDGVVLQVPLYAAALQQLRSNDIVARMEYRTLRDPKPLLQLSLAPVQKNQIKDAPEAEERLKKALDAAGACVTSVRTGVLPAAPAASCGCSPYCPARDVCRIPGGPVEAPR